MVFSDLGDPEQVAVFITNSIINRSARCVEQPEGNNVSRTITALKAIK